MSGWIEWWERHPDSPRWKPWRCAVRNIQRRILSYIHPTRMGRLNNRVRHGGHRSLIWRYEPAVEITDSTEPVLVGMFEQYSTHRCKDCFTEFRSLVLRARPALPNQDYENDAGGYVHAVRLRRPAPVTDGGTTP